MFVGGRDVTLLVFIPCGVLFTIMVVVYVLLEHIIDECRKP